MDTSLAYALHQLVFSMDRGADKLLKEEFGISYQRAYFLFMLQQLGMVSQQALAKALGYSAASVSTMVAELVKTGYVVVQPDPEHGRKRLISLSPHGDEHVRKGSRLLDTKLSETIARAGINEQEYLKLTLALYETLTQSGKGKNEHGSF